MGVRVTEMSERSRRMKACVNGGGRRADHAGVPVTPTELAASAAEAVAAGAEAVHVHTRGADGRESLRAADVAAAVTAVRQACPGPPGGVSPRLWVTRGDPQAPHAARASRARPGAGQRPGVRSVQR